jgi:hypothetical protein
MATPACKSKAPDAALSQPRASKAMAPDIVPLPDPPGTPVVLARLKTDDSGSGPHDIAVDSSAIYVTEQDWASADDLPTKITRIPFDGGAPKVLATRQHAGQSIVATGQAVFWIVAGNPDRNIAASVVKLSLLNGTIRNVAKTFVFDDAALVADDNNLYFGDIEAEHAQLFRLPIVGGKRAPISSSRTTENISVLAVDKSNVYWLSLSSIMKAPLTGGTAVELARTSGAGNVWGMASDGAFLYWTDRNNYTSDEGRTGALRRVSVHGGVVETIASKLPGRPWGVAVDDTHVYWVINAERNGGIMRARKAGGPASVFIAGQPSAVKLVLDNDYVYWCNTGDGVVAKASKLRR